MIRAALVAVAAVVVVAMLTNTSFRRRQITRALADNVEGTERYVDAGIVLHVVERSDAGEELLPGKPKLRILRTHRTGGIIDTKRARPDLVRESEQPVVWYCSEQQEQIILHGDEQALGQLVYGSEGAGKSVCLVMWVAWRWNELMGERREIGVTAPTQGRLEIVLAEFLKLFPTSWFTYRASEGVMYLCDGTRVRLVSTYRQSKAQGSPIQGFNWSAAARDEGQDQVDVHEDIESRGRAAPNGRYKQLITATAKDDPEWRTLRDQLTTGGAAALWTRRTLYGRNSPFIPASFWDAKAQTMSKREYARRVEAKDVGPERATYPDWSRETNLIVVPELGWTDVTENELRGTAPNRALLVGHDPGNLWDVSLPLSAFVRNQDYQAYARGLKRPFWVVRGEINTEQSTTELHILALLKYARARQLNLLSASGRVQPDARQMLVRADPASNADNRTHKSIYTQFANHGIHIKPAAYNADNTGHGKVPLDPGIEVINKLICAADGERRLFVERLENGAPAAPRLVEALETAERDLAGKADAQRKNADDKSHWPAALRYALWAIERPRLQLKNTGEA